MARKRGEIENELKPLLQQKFELEQKIDRLNAELSEAGTARAEEFNARRDAESWRKSPFETEGNAK